MCHKRLTYLILLWSEFNSCSPAWSTLFIMIKSAKAICLFVNNKREHDINKTSISVNIYCFEGSLDSWHFESVHECLLRKTRVSKDDRVVRLPPVKRVLFIESKTMIKVASFLHYMCIWVVFYEIEKKTVPVALLVHTFMYKKLIIYLNF